MFPARRELRQRTQNESTKMRTRMRQNRIGISPHQSVQVDDIKVQASRRIRDGALTPERLFNGLKCLQKRFRRCGAGERGDRIHVQRLIGRGDRRALPEAGKRAQFQTGQVRQSGHRALGSAQRRAAIRCGKVRSDCNENHASLFRKTIRLIRLERRPSQRQYAAKALVSLDWKSMDWKD